MNILYVIYRYLSILKTPKEERKRKWLARSIMFGGKSAPGYVFFFLKYKSLNHLTINNFTLLNLK